MDIDPIHRLLDVVVKAFGLHGAYDIVSMLKIKRLTVEKMLVRRDEKRIRVPQHEKFEQFQHREPDV